MDISNRLAFLVSSLITGYPDDEVAENLKILLEDEEVDQSCSSVDSELWSELKTKLCLAFSSEEQIQNLRSAYIDIFDRGQSANPPYESDYCQNQAMSKGVELADLAGFYRAFGLDFGVEGSAREMLDHISLELEFYSYLLMKQNALSEKGDQEGVEIVLDARKKFLSDHLGRFVGAIGERPGVAGHHFYSSVYSWCNKLITKECKELEIQPIPAAFFGQKNKEPETMSCGTIGDCSAGLMK